ncbi:MAG TPA: IS256 family transposase, partial [Dialister sp.]|nr:IS256 family transposase [Dialister sp.]
MNKGNDELIRTLFEKGFNEVLKAQSDAQIKAKRYDRTEERTDYRNGSR